MTTADNYRRYAMLVRKLASNAEGEAERGALIELATRWDAFVGRSYLPKEASREPAAIKAAIEGLLSDVVFELETERSTRNHGKRVTTGPRDA